MEVDLKQLVHKDQTIKIVPSVEDSLEKLGVNTGLDENIQFWLEHLRLQWKTWKKSPATDNHFNTLFQCTADPYTVALVCCVKCEEFKDSKPKSLPYYIIESLNARSQSNGCSPPDVLKLPAFQFAISQRNQHFVKLVIRTYHVYTIKETILPLVKEMIKNNNCKQASQIVLAMDLCNDVPVEDLLFPLILQDKANMIDEYLNECPSQVQPLLLFLDSLLDKSFSIKDFAQQYIEQNKVCHVKYDKIHYKPLGKLVARLCNKFNVPIETCKNLSKNRTTGGLRYLIHQKYVEHNVSSSVWDDLVKDSLRQSACVQEFIDMLVDYDTAEALKWATYFQMPQATLPLALQNMSLQEVHTEEQWDNGSEPNATQNFYKLPLLENNVIIIDTAEMFYDTVTTLLNCSILSIDCEWKPSFGAAQSQVALIQIATLDKVYLIDTLILNNKQYLSFWYRFNKSVLDNAEIIKVGFGLEQDLKEIKASVNGLGSIKLKGEGLLDLSLLWKSVMNAGLALPTDCEGSSLSSLVQTCFGAPLEKAEQCSNWELRPLRQTQINYAAIDAYVLLEIYKYLQKLCEEQHINFEEICNYVMLEKKMKTAKKCKAVDTICALTKDLQRYSKCVKILIEYELANLVAYLRCCDIDTTVTSPAMYWYDTVNLALSENRLILTSKLKLSSSPIFPQNNILDICKTTSFKEQLQKVLLNFNITVKQSDIFNRCLHCNGKDLKKMTPDEVKDMCNKYKSAKSSNTSKRYPSHNDDDDAYYDNFLSDSDGDDLYVHQPVAQVNTARVLTVPCLTSKGANIDISNADGLSTSCKPATLCETCGKLYWDEEPLLKSALKVVSPLVSIVD